MAMRAFWNTLVISTHSGVAALASGAVRSGMT